jgi:hypothetical protein
VESQKQNGKGEALSRKTIENIKDATGHLSWSLSFDGPLLSGIFVAYRLPLLPESSPGSHAAIAELGCTAGASEEEIMFTLAECNNDVNETTSRLIDSESMQS